MNREQLAHRLVLIKAMVERLKLLDAATRADFRALSRPGTVEAIYSGDDLQAKVRLDKPRVTVVVNEERLTDWAMRHAPTEVETRPRVRQSYATIIRKAAESAGDGVDPRTGELLPEGIVYISVGDPTVVVQTPVDPQRMLRDAADVGDLQRALDPAGDDYSFTTLDELLPGEPDDGEG